MTAKDLRDEELEAKVRKLVMESMYSVVVVKL